MTKFFVDNNLSKKLARGMHGFGEEVMHLTEKFPADTPDVVWLRFVGENGYIVITCDKRISWNPSERKAFRKHKVGAFFLGGKNKNHCDIIRQLVRCWHRIKDFDKKTNKPYAFSINAAGTKFHKLSI